MSEQARKTKPVSRRRRKSKSKKLVTKRQPNAPAVAEGVPSPTGARKSDFLQILDLMKVGGSHSNGQVYCIGAGATRLTFQSQQHRALNLIWALKEKWRRENLSNFKSKTVVVIGAGLAGITAALAAKEVGATVTLIERKGEVLHLQRGTQMRFIHPNIYDWPADHAVERMTDLPILNWGAGMAARVVEVLLEQWLSLAGTVERRFNFDVRELLTLGNRRTLLTAEGTDAHRPTNHNAENDVLILAVGF